ncbi:MAG: hypothetical protein B7733_13705 [Myxococcales bacterium FL481]|nr:MAG: hypothetical protein B7733_13705 [Myxococcales bacterium FL481]
MGKASAIAGRGLAAAALLTGAGLPTRVEAAACCMSATALGIGRLLTWEMLAVGLRVSWAEGIGQWDTGARFQLLDNGERERLLTTQLWGMLRMSRRWSAYAAIPFVTPYRAIDGDGEWGAGFGDLRGGVRWDVVEPGESRRIPGIALHAAVLAATGRPTDRSRSTLGADVTGRGVWTLVTGATVEHSVETWFVRLDLGATVPLPRRLDRPAVVQRFGPGVQGAVSGGYQLRSGLVVSSYLRATYEGRIRHDEDPLPRSSARDTAAGLGLSWRVADHWTVQAAVEAPLAAHGLGDNRFAYALGTLGLRYGYWNF